jgi:hypothetical protein
MFVVQGCLFVHSVSPVLNLFPGLFHEIYGVEFT